MKKMKLSKKLMPTVVASVLAVPALLAVAPAQAELSATVAASNMYLWRGQNLTPDGAAVSGSIDYSNGGFYAGIWTSTETGGHETDLYLGYGGEIGGFGYDISFWEYLYPENGTAPNDSLGDTDASELVLSGSFQGFSLAAYIQMDSDNNDDNYFTLGYAADKLSVTYGFWDLEKPGNEYSHITVGYSLTDELSAAVSIADNDVAVGGIEEDPLFQITYSKSFDL